MSLSQELARLKAIKKEADTIKSELQALAEADKNAPAATLKRLEKLAGDLDDAARQAARDRRQEIIDELTQRIQDFDALLALGLSRADRQRAKKQRAKLVGQRAFHRGRAGTDFEGLVSKEDVDRLAALITEVNKAVAEKKKAVAHINGAISIAMAATNIIGRITG